MNLLGNINRNINSHLSLFDKDGMVTELGRRALSALSLKSSAGEDVANIRALSHHEVEGYLQAAFFRPHEAKFSFQVAQTGDTPSEEQLNAFRALGMVDKLTVAPTMHYDVGVIFGGLLGAVESRITNLLNQGCSFSSVALLGGQRKLFADRELGDHLKKVIGDERYDFLSQADQLPKTEFEMMLCVWDSFTQRNRDLSRIPVIEVNSSLRVNKIKEAPGTPDTVVDLANTLTCGLRVAGLAATPSSFILSSSQPHGVRQLEDFLSTMSSLSYPGLTTVDVVAYQREAPASLTLYGQELAKLVHAQFLGRY